MKFKKLFASLFSFPLPFRIKTKEKREKTMAITTIAKIEKDNHKYFESLTEDGQKKNIKTLNYIKQLGSLTGINVNRWDIDKVFGVEDSIELLDDKSEINKRFFAKAGKQEKKKTSKTKDVDAISGLTRELKKRVTQLVRDKKNTLNRSIEDNKHQLSNLYTSINRTTENITKAKQELSTVRDDGKFVESVKEEIMEILNDGCWVNPVVGGKYLYFNTENDIVISHVNKEAQVDLKVNVGQLAVRIDLDGFGVIVIPYKNNIMCNDGDTIFHPHINYDGNVCWGDVYDKVGKWHGEFKIANILKLLYSLLMTYNDGNPYVSIDKMELNKNNKCVPYYSWMVHPDNVKEVEENGPDPNGPELSARGISVSESRTDGYTVTIGTSSGRSA